jgi:hypothetical protein
MDKIKAHFKNSKEVYKTLIISALAGAVIGSVLAHREKDVLIKRLVDTVNGQDEDIHALVDIYNGHIIQYHPDHIFKDYAIEEEASA